MENKKDLKLEIGIHEDHGLDSSNLEFAVYEEDPSLYITHTYTHRSLEGGFMICCMDTELPNKLRTIADKLESEWRNT